MKSASLVATAALMGMQALAHAQASYPTRTVRIIAPSAVGGAADTVARAIGVTTARRVTALPHVPTIAEAGVPGYESVSWFGLVAPAGTPKDVIARLHQEVVAILRTPEIRERFARDGTEVVAGSPEAFDAYIRAEIVKWAKVVKSAGIKPE